MSIFRFSEDQNGEEGQPVDAEKALVWLAGLHPHFAIRMNGSSGVVDLGDGREMSFANPSVLPYVLDALWRQECGQTLHVDHSLDCADGILDD